jgi:hypothetical protein
VSFESNPYDERQAPGYGTSPEPTPKRRISRMAVIGGIAGVVALGGAGIAYAESGHPTTSHSAALAASSSSSTTSPGSTAKIPHGPRFRIGAFGAFGAFAGAGPVVHGQFTVPSGSGYKTVAVQTGSVTAVSSSQITVKSADGYTHTYQVVPATMVDAQAGGISSVKVGNQVRVVATTQGGKDTAASIADATLGQSSRAHFGFPAMGPAGAAGPAGGTKQAGFPGVGPAGGPFGSVTQ